MIFIEGMYVLYIHLILYSLDLAGKKKITILSLYSICLVSYMSNLLFVAAFKYAKRITKANVRDGCCTG